MDYTGERYLPEVQGGIALEHKHRYLLACELARGKEVLDIASGEGYGSFMLSGVARRVTGIDISHEAVAHASAQYVRENLGFVQGSAASIPVPDASVDVVISFETIEHHHQHEEMLQEIKRVLRPGGVLYMSSPDRVEYSEVPEYDNEYHVKELTKAEFEELIAHHFANYTIFGQRIAYGSVIGSEVAESEFLSWNNASAKQNPDTGLSRAVYILALASDGELPKLASSILEDALEHADAYRCQKEDTERCEWQKSDTEAHLHLCLQQIQDCNAEMQKLSEEIEKRGTEIEKRGAKIKKNVAEIQNCQKRIHDLEWELQSVYNSRSWKLTMPLRKVTECVRSLCAPQSLPSFASKILARCLMFPLVQCLRMDKAHTCAVHSVENALQNPGHALKMLRGQKGLCMQLARLSFVLGWVAAKTGGVCATLHVCGAALHSGNARQHLSDYLNLAGKPVQHAAVSKVADNGYIDALVTAHKNGSVRPPVDTVRVRVAAEGNHFFREIAHLIACGFTDAGVKATVEIDSAQDQSYSVAESDGAASQQQSSDLHLIIAPHEYFIFIPQGCEWPFAHSRLWMLNTEQSHTHWFAGAAKAFGMADLILDMDFDMSRMLSQQGLLAEHLPLGFSPSCALFNGLQPVAASAATMGLPSRIRNSEVLADPLQTALHERPLDCCFFGASVARRTEFFAKNAELFAEMQVYLRLLPMNAPLQAGVNTSLTTEATSSIIRRSKITLNIHQTENSYFEWHRIVLQGLWQGALVVSEPCTPALPFRPNRDFVSVDLAYMPEALEYFTRSEDGRALAEKIRATGYKTLISQCQIGNRLQELLDIYGTMPGVNR